MSVKEMRKWAKLGREFMNTRAGMEAQALGRAYAERVVYEGLDLVAIVCGKRRKGGAR